MKIYEVAHSDFTNEVTSIHSGQVDSRLSLIYDNETVGYVDYTIYEGMPSINMIEVFDKGKKYGSRLIKKLQSMYPNQELEWGVTTEEGESLRKSMKYKKLDTEYVDDFNRLEYISNLIRELTTKSEEIWGHDSLSDEDKKHIREISERLNELHDEKYDLESLLYDKKAHKYIIDYRN